MSSSATTSPDTLPHDAHYNNSGPSEAQHSNKRRRSPEQEKPSPNGGEQGANNAGQAAAKRIACVICRKRKLKCDGNKPSCSTCKRLGHDCAYDEVRRKSGPKRGYVKALEERLKQVEEMLKSQEPSASKASPIPHGPSFQLGHTNSSGLLATLNADFGVTNPDIAVVNDRDPERWRFPGESPQPVMDEMGFNSQLDMNMDQTFTWEMIGLGLDEPLPPQETIDELHQIYFEKIHPSLPMIHKYRYLAAMNLAPNQRPPVCLRYAMWTMACSVTEKYMDLKEHFYQRARKYVEQDYLKGHGEHMISVGHAQTHVLLCSYEFKMMYFPRAWMSTGSAVRLCQMMGLHRLDGVGLDVKQCLPPARDWTEREERRRTFWMAFCEDRYASIGTGWPMTFDEKDILTNLPSSEEAFEKSKSESTRTLAEAFNPSGASGLSAFGGVALMAALFGRNLVHLHRPDSDDNDSDLNGEFWKRHRHMDNILLNTSLSLPSHLKLPAGVSSPNIVFTNMNIHTSTICLHQAAIYKADKNRLPANVSKDSKKRCINSANEIASIMRMIVHMDLCAMNPFISFCLYVAARVFVQYLKARPDDDATSDALQFLLSAMNVMKVKNPLTESFLVQLDVDLESLGLRDPKYKSFVYGFANNPQVVASHKPGPNGRIDQCNFLKIVDEPEHPDGPVSTDSNLPNSNSNISPQSIHTNIPITTQTQGVFQSYSDTLWAQDGTSFHDGRGPGLVVFPDSGPTSRATNLAMPAARQQQTSYGAQRNISLFAANVPGLMETDVDMSSGGANDQLTPGSSAPSDGRSNGVNRNGIRMSSDNGNGSLQPHKSGQGMSGRSSYETSPVMPNQDGIANGISNGGGGMQQQQQQQQQQMGMQQQVSATFYTNNGNDEFSFGMGQQGMWGASQGQGQQEGLTPIGEGVFRELMGIGGGFGGAWDGQS